MKRFVFSRCVASSPHPLAAAFYAIALSALLLTGSATATRAGTYSAPQYSGGTWYGPGPQGVFGNYPDHAVSGGWGGGSGGSKSADCSGAISTTFTWQPTAGQTDPAPINAVVVESSTVGASGASYPASAVGGSVADGFGHSQSLTQTPIMAGPTQVGTSGSASLSGVRYSVYPGNAVNVSCSPSATASASATASSSLTYSASVTPVVINLVGVTTNNEVLTGQQVTATLSGIPGGSTNITYSWSVTGDVFKTWDPTAPNTTNSTQLVPLSAADKAAASFSFYDKKDETITVNCTANFTAPDGTALSVSAQSKPITVKKPTASWGVDPATVTIGGQTQPNTIGFFDASSINGTFFVNTIWYPAKLTVPAPFSGGTGCFAQLVTPTASITRVPTGTGAAKYVLKIMNSQGQWVAPGQGLDGGFPYPFGLATDANGNLTGQAAASSAWSAAGTGASGDRPSGSESAPDVDNGGSDWRSSAFSHTFVTWLMYKPPANGSQGTVWVPVQKASWSGSGNATGGPTNWSATGSYSPPSPANTNDYPQWTIVISGQQYRP